MGRHSRDVQVIGENLIIPVGKKESEKIVLSLAFVQAVKQVYNVNPALKKKTPEVVVGTIAKALKNRKGLGDWSTENVPDALDYLAKTGQIEPSKLAAVS
jgi:hypothetical protein